MSGYDALGTKMSDLGAGGPSEPVELPSAVVIKTGSKRNGSQVVVWTIVGVILVMAVVAIVVLATRKTNGDNDGDHHLRHKVHKLHHKLKHTEHRLDSAKHNLLKMENELALAEEGLALCETTCEKKPIKPIPIKPPYNPLPPFHPVGPTPVKPVIPVQPIPIKPPYNPLPPFHPVKPATPTHAVVNKYPPRTFAFNLAQIPSGHYQTYCPDSPTGLVHHGSHGMTAQRAGGLTDLEPAVDSLKNYGLVTPRTPGVVTPPPQMAVQPMMRSGMAVPQDTRPVNPPHHPPQDTRPVNPPQGGEGGISHKSGEELLAYLKMKPTGVIVFVMDGCGFCTKIKQELPKLSGKYNVTLVDAKEMSKLPKEMHSNGFPTLHVYHKGELKKKHPGYMPADKLDAMISEAMDA